MDTPSIPQQLAQRVTTLEAEREAERPHLATKAGLRELEGNLKAEIGVLRLDMRWGLVLLATIAAGEWIPHVRSLF